MGKILLIVSERNDPVTDEIYKWLLRLDEGCIIKRLNYEDEILHLNINLQKKEVSIRTREEHILISKVHKIWYRRGFLNYLKNKDTSPYRNYISDEYSKLHDGLWALWEEKSISSFLNNRVNKLEMLFKAEKFGIKIPNTIYTDSKKELECFFEDNKKGIITKAIENAGFYNEKEKQTFGEGTKIVEKSDIENSPEYFCISKFQEKVEKLFEIRTMYYKQHFFSMAIISQQNSKTQVDFRNYDEENPNRNIPYQLPENIELKIIKLMKSLDLVTGSIDLILTTDNEYVFLEVNPFGQYLPVDYLLGDEISKLIAIDILN
ncbi:MAG: hypothetical protein COB15_17485 [Flavobacteriales bacterium]|nr:MAG: hypothetical protein COB15_17485 [Flavobacteriales bacterium]